MRQLLRKPLLLSFILSVPLWIVFNNYIVALSVALLVAFLLSMLETMLALRRETGKRPDSDGRLDMSCSLLDTSSGSPAGSSAGSTSDAPHGPSSKTPGDSSSELSSNSTPHR